jgi:hypothetical protein
MPFSATASSHNVEAEQESSGATDRQGQSSASGSGSYSSLKESIAAVREKARDTKDHLRHGLEQSSTSPEEDHAGGLSAAKQRAIDQTKARRRATNWLRSGQEEDEVDQVEEGGHTPFQASITNSMQDEEEEEEEESAVSTAFLISYFVAGGAAGATSRTVVSPLERLKIIMQVQPKAAKGAAGSKGAYSGVISGLNKMWHEEGFKGFMRGNGINCLRIAPYSAVQFSTYEILKNALTDQEGELDTVKRLTAGAIAGIASVVSSEYDASVSYK